MAKEEHQARLVTIRGRENFYITYREDGTTKRVSTHTSHKAQAKASLTAFVAALKGQGNLKPRLISDALGDYIRDRVALGKNGVALSGRAARLNTFFHDTLATDVSRLDGRAFVERQLGRGYSPKTVADDLSLLRSALKFEKEAGRLDVVPRFDMPAPPAPKERFLSEKEARLLLRAAKATHLKLFITIALTTGARTCSILDLRWEQVDLDRKVINFNPPGKAKTNKRRPIVPMNQDIELALRSACERSQSEFVIEYAGKRVTRIAKGFREAVRRAKLDAVTPHTLRHTAATRMVQRGIPIHDVAAMLGHTKIETTYKTYVKFTPGHLANAASALSLRSAPLRKLRSTTRKDEQNRSQTLRPKLKKGNNVKRLPPGGLR